MLIIADMGSLISFLISLNLIFLKEEDEEQGTFKFGRQKEQATYAGMDDEEKALLKVSFSSIL